MKKKFLPLFLLICLTFLYTVKQNTIKQSTNLNRVNIKNLSDLQLDLNNDKYPILSSINNHKKNYIKNFYHMQPELDGIDDRIINESWTFEHNGKIYYAFQENQFLKLKKEDEDLSRTHYYLSIYDPNKKLISEIVENNGKYEKFIHMVFRNGNNLDATLISTDPQTKKVNKKVHKIVKIPNTEYISGISDYLKVAPYNKVLGVKNKTFCIYSENELKLNNYNYKIINKKAKTQSEPWNIEFEEVGEKSDDPINSRYFFDSEKNIIYKSSYGNISIALTDYDEFYNKCTNGNNKAAKITIPLNFWLMDRDNLDEIKLQITFKNKNSDALLKRTSRQKIEKLNANTVLLTLMPENFNYKSGEKISKKDISNALESNLTYPSDDLRVQTLARSITGKAKGNLEKSFLIMNWIDANIKWTYDSNTEVLQTLNTKKGDCSERSALFITLARASGIPTTYSGGYLLETDCLGGHAWVKIFENNRWIELDPSNPRLISTYYLTAKAPLLPKDFKEVQVIELKYKNGSIKKINRKTPFIKHNKKFYSNRILGLSFKMPDYAKLKTSKDINCALFNVSMIQNIFTLESLMKNYMISDTQNFVIISDYDKNLFKETKYAKNARFNGIEVGQRRFINQDGHTLLIEMLIIPKRNVKGIVYSYPLKTDLMINFLVLGKSDDINALFLKDKMPPLFVDILKDTKRINKEF